MATQYTRGSRGNGVNPTEQHLPIELLNIIGNNDTMLKRRHYLFVLFPVFSYTYACKKYYSVLNGIRQGVALDR